MKYIAILRQEGGCDYTIGCGVNVIHFEADHALDAGKKLKEIIRDQYTASENPLNSVVYYEVTGKYEADIARWYSAFEFEKIKALEDELQIKELAELERLLKKYGK